jgi:hypothetical protein
MPARIQYDQDSVCVMRLDGTVKRSEFGEVQDAMSLQIDAGEQPRIPAILDSWQKRSVALGITRPFDQMPLRSGTFRGDRVWARAGRTKVR